MKPNSIISIFTFFLIVFSCTMNEHKFVVDPDANNSTTIGQSTNKEAYKGKESIVLHPNAQYGLESKEIKVKGGDRLLGKVFIKNTCNTFNFHAYADWNHYYANAYIENCNPNNWNEVNLIVNVPDSIEHAKVKFYVFYYGQDTAYVDYLTISKQRTSFFMDSIPSNVAKPLTYELLKELNINGLFPTKENFNKLIKDKCCKKVFKYHDVSLELYIDYISLNPSIFDELKLNKRTHLIKGKEPKRVIEHNTIAGYTDKIVYNRGEEVSVNITNIDHYYTLQIFKLGSDYNEINRLNIKAQVDNQYIFSKDFLEDGIYGIKIRNEKETFNIPLIINNHEQTDLIILAPITTWHAYNDYGGKSLYRNRIDTDPVNYVSTKRPLLSADFDSTFLGHDLYILNNIYNYFASKQAVNIYPDYYLQKHPELFENVKTVILAQHCEYFSPQMFSKLEALSKSKNIISLGGNQCYYKIEWHDDFSTIECRKNGTFHKNSLMPGGLWRSNLTSEARILGVAYTDAGYATYEPYTITKSNHWLLNGLENISNETLFGVKGIDKRGISGDEMDKMDRSSPSNTVSIAKGNNPNNGGGEIVIIEKDSIATLSTGSIASGAGLNVDTVFTKILDNFLERYHY